MLGAAYDASTGGQTVSAASDLLEIQAPSDAALLIDGLEIGKSADATSENIASTCKVVTGAATSGSGGASVTPTKRSPASSASGATVERNNTTQISGGTTGWNKTFAFNLTGGLEHVFDPPIEVPPSGYFVVALEAPAGARVIHTSVAYREVGGS